MINSVREEMDGLYFLNDESNSNKKAQGNSYYPMTSISRNDEIYLEHFRLGHLSLFYLKKSFPNLFQNKNPSLF